MAETKTLITADQLELMSFPDERVELSEGELIRMPPAGAESSHIAAQLLLLIGQYAKSRDLGTVFGSDAGFRLDEHTVRSPDVSYVSRERANAVGLPEGFWPGAPDLAVEVVSPSDTRAEVAKKITEYFQAGTRLVWVVYPRARQVYVYHSPRAIAVLSTDEVLSGEDVLPGFSLPVRDIFA